MLTCADHTVPDCLEVLDYIPPLRAAPRRVQEGRREPRLLAELARRIQATGATSYMEVVSTSPEARLRSAQVARDIGIDRLLGGTQVEEALEVLAGSRPLPPVPGLAARPSDQARGLARPGRGGLPRFRALGCAGVDLLAYRATEADPLELVRAARRGTDGTCSSRAASTRRADPRAHEAGADAFTIGSAAFDGAFAPRLGSLRSQLRAVLDACG